jgi:PIN domain nuclease of toxin-antitoxin system
LKLLLDTTYFFPVIGISIKGIQEDAIIKLIKKGYEISLSNITIFELSAKGAKYVATGDIESHRVIRGIRAIVYDEKIEKIPLYDTSILLTSFELRRILEDFVDCLILSSAINKCDILVTEDKDIKCLEEEKEFKKIIKLINPKFKIQTLIDIL